VVCSSHHPPPQPGQQPLSDGIGSLLKLQEPKQLGSVIGDLRKLEQKLQRVIGNLFKLQQQQGKRPNAQPVIVGDKVCKTLVSDKKSWTCTPLANKKLMKGYE